MAKTKKYESFREFYEDEDRPKKKPPKHVNESQKKKNRMKQQFKFLDPKNMREEDFDEFEDYE